MIAKNYYCPTCKIDIQVYHTDYNQLNDVCNDCNNKITFSGFPTPIRKSDGSRIEPQTKIVLYWPDKSNLILVDNLKELESYIYKYGHPPIIQIVTIDQSNSEILKTEYKA